MSDLGQDLARHEKSQVGGEGQEFAREFAVLRDQVARSILGQANLIERLLIALLADGHLLVEGAPGLAKTTAVKQLAAGLDGDFHRIQFTPDLLPADLTGTEIYRPERRQLPLRPGAHLPQPAPGRRGQPGAGQGPVGTAGGHGRASGHRGP